MDEGVELEFSFDRLWVVASCRMDRCGMAPGTLRLSIFNEGGIPIRRSDFPEGVYDVARRNIHQKIQSS